MRLNYLIWVGAVLMLAAMGSAEADMVILKSGEIFQTEKAWKENGVVNYLHNGQVVSVDEKDVERLIHSAAPLEPAEPSGQRPHTQTPPSATGKSTGHLPSKQLPTSQDVGHLGLRWGLTPTQIEGLVWVETDPAYGGVQQYNHEQKNKRFGRARVDNIFYGFWQNGLYTLLIEVGNYLDFLDLKAEAFRRYGETRSQGEQIERYRWKDHGSDRLLTYDPQSDTGYLWMRSQTLHEMVERRYPVE